MSAPASAHRQDAESLGWLEALSAPGPAHVDALERLHALLLRAARFEAARRRRSGVDVGSAVLDDLAVEAANDALTSVLRKLHTYRGDSRFTTWAYKFALLETAVKVRRHAWKDREVALDAERWNRPPDAVRDAMAEVLTPYQRAVLVALVLDGVPIDVLAERRHTTRGALYKTLHDSRRKLRARLAEDGLTAGLSLPGEDQPAMETIAP